MVLMLKYALIFAGLIYIPRFIGRILRPLLNPTNTDWSKVDADKK